MVRDFGWVEGKSIFSKNQKIIHGRIDSQSILPICPNQVSENILKDFMKCSVTGYPKIHLTIS